MWSDLVGGGIYVSAFSSTLYVSPISSTISVYGSVQLLFMIVDFDSLPSN